MGLLESHYEFKFKEIFRQWRTHIDSVLSAKHADKKLQGLIRPYVDDSLFWGNYKICNRSKNTHSNFESRIGKLDNSAFAGVRAKKNW